PHRELPRRSPRALRPGEEPVEQHSEPPPEGQLVADRLRKLERLVDRRHGLPRRDPALLLASRQAPGTPSGRPQPFGDGGARKPSKLSDRPYSELLQLLVALALEWQQLERQRREEGAGAVVGDDQRLPRPGHVRRGERGEPALRRPRPRVPRRPDRRQGALERRLEAAVEPLHAL